MMVLNKVYYKGELVQAIFMLPNPTIVDINCGTRHIKGVNRSELMVPLIDAEAQIHELQDKIKKVKELAEQL